MYATCLCDELCASLVKMECAATISNHSGALDGR